jgi:glutamine synthetase
LVGRLELSDAEDVVRFVSKNSIRILNLCHIPEEGRLKVLSFSVADKARMLEILELGERVDGSNLFSNIEPGKSDIYVMPEVNRAYVNPFSTLPTLNVMCDYLDENGMPLDFAPRSVLIRAEEKLRRSNGVALKALAELEYYIISKHQVEVQFRNAPDQNYHESAPFTKFEDLRSEILAMLNIAGIPTKYGHSEVGRIYTKDDMLLEQHEIELAPQSLTEMAETVAIAKWMIRNVCAKHGVSVTFIPKFSVDHAGNGMHIHLCGQKNAKNIVPKPDGKLSSEAMQMIGGILKFAPSLAAFGNPTPVSYLRFIARKESPMYICWSTRNRSALVRIPLWWGFKQKRVGGNSCRETLEYRAPDAFANTYLLFAGLALATEYGLANSEQALKIARDLHVETSDRGEKRLPVLPRSCSESAENLEKHRESYEADGVFPKRLIDKTIEKLGSSRDKKLWKGLMGKPDEIENEIMRYIHYG